MMNRQILLGYYFRAWLILDKICFCVRDLRAESGAKRLLGLIQNFVRDLNLIKWYCEQKNELYNDSGKLFYVVSLGAIVHLFHTHENSSE